MLTLQQVNFWNTVRPFITKSNENITIKAEEKQKVKIKNKNEHISIKKDQYINDENIFVEMFNNHKHRGKNIRKGP